MNKPSRSDPEAIFVAQGGGEIIGDSPDRRVEILSDHDALHATWSRFGPGREGADLHVHHQHTDLFYVLEGTFTLRLGIEDGNVEAGPGTLVCIPPLVVHGFRNGSDAETRFLNLHAPGRAFADYMRAIRDGRSFSYDQHDPPADGGRSPSDAQIGGHEFAFDHAGTRVSLLTDVEEIAVCETQADAGVPSPTRHLHQRHVESFFVIDGAMTFEAGGRRLQAEAGSWVQIPPGVPHTFSALDDGPAHFLNLHTPSSGFGTFLRGLFEARSDEERAAIRAGFDEVPA